MKLLQRSLFIGLLVIIGSGSAMAQKNTVVGKWKVAAIDIVGLSIDLENPVAAKKLLADQIKQSGQSADSATIEMAYSAMTMMLDKMYIEFTSDGKGIYVIPDPMAGTKTDTAAYTVDYEKGLLNTVKKEGGVDKKEQANIKFDGDYLTMVKNNEEKDTIKLKRVKE
jgi:hypothetical protein